MSESTPESNIPKAHRWNDVGEKCLDCGDSDWMNDPICRPRFADPDVTATPDISVAPSTSNSALVPVDVLMVLDAEEAALRLQVQKGAGLLRGALHDLQDARLATQELFAGYRILLAMAKCKDDQFFDWPDGWDWERLELAIARVSSRQHELGETAPCSSCTGECRKTA